MTHITFIAGGSQGLGAALVNTFIAKNHVVYEFSRSGHLPQHIDCDFNQPNEAHKIFENLFQSHSENTYSNVNLVINTAVLAPFGSIASASNKATQAHLNINIAATFLLLQSFIKLFQNSRAKKTIAYISSGAARRAILGLAMYSASKAFFERLLDTMAAEQNKETNPINCMIINPGVMNTGMQEEIRSQSAEDFPMVDMWTELHRNGQLADPNDIAAVCIELIEKSGVNGGYYTAQDLLSQT